MVVGLSDVRLEYRDREETRDIAITDLMGYVGRVASLPRSVSAGLEGGAAAIHNAARSLLASETYWSTFIGQDMRARGTTEAGSQRAAECFRSDLRRYLAYKKPTS